MAMTRNRYADLLRVVAIGGVVYGHWLLVSVTYSDGRLSGVDAVDYVRWGRWVTWLFQVMPVFFLVGGYVNGQSWVSRQARGEGWTPWVRGRAVRLLWPTAVYVVWALVMVAIARVAGMPRGELALGGWLAALHLWFLPVYLLLIALTPVMYAAHRRWGLAVPACMAVGAALVNVVARGLNVHPLGYADYLLVWGCIHQWGFAWQDRTLTSPRRRLYVLTVAGGVVLAALVTTRTFNVDMVGSGNTNPPSIALLAFAAAQTGLVLLAEPWVSAALPSLPRLWSFLARSNVVVMTVYLWHFVPVIIISAAFYVTGVLPQPGVGSGDWFAWRPVWFLLLTAVFVPLIVFVMWAERPLVRLPAGVGPSGAWSPLLLLVGLFAASAGLSRLAVDGFAPGGGIPTATVAAFALGMVAIVCTGRAGAEDGQEAAARPDVIGGPSNGGRPATVTPEP